MPELRVPDSQVFFSWKQIRKTLHTFGSVTQPFRYSPPPIPHSFLGISDDANETRHVVVGAIYGYATWESNPTIQKSDLISRRMGVWVGVGVGHPSLCMSPKCRLFKTDMPWAVLYTLFTVWRVMLFQCRDPRWLLLLLLLFSFPWCIASPPPAKQQLLGWGWVFGLLEQRDWSTTHNVR